MGARLVSLDFRQYYSMTGYIRKALALSRTLRFLAFFSGHLRTMHVSAATLAAYLKSKVGYMGHDGVVRKYHVWAVRLDGHVLCGGPLLHGFQDGGGMFWLRQIKIIITIIIICIISLAIPRQKLRGLDRAISCHRTAPYGRTRLRGDVERGAPPGAGLAWPTRWPGPQQHEPRRRNGYGTHADGLLVRRHAP